MRMKLKIAALALALAILPAAAARADINVTPGSGAVIFDFTCFTSKHCGAVVPIDSAGAAFGVTGNPFVFSPSGGSFAVTAASGALASGAVVDLVALSAPVAPATATATKSFLLGAQATTTAVNPTNGQQSALSSDTNNNLLVSSGGAPNLLTAQVSVATSDTATVAARALRRSVTITQVTGTQDVFCSNTTATAGNGQIIPGVKGASWTVSTSAAIRCIALTGAQTVSVAEIY